MEDKDIVDLYWTREESAIHETEKKYGRYCHYVASRILQSDEDAEEVVNDTYLRAWNSIPPTRPQSLKHYLGTICRNLSIDRYTERKSRMRDMELTGVLDELAECIPDRSNGVNVEELALQDAIRRFVAELPENTQRVFVMRYWYACPISEIAKETSSKESKIKMLLMRTREKFKVFLESEGFIV